MAQENLSGEPIGRAKREKLSSRSRESRLGFIAPAIATTGIVAAALSALRVERIPTDEELRMTELLTAAEEKARSKKRSKENDESVEE